MAERDYTEPSNEQLANFLVVYARNCPGVLGHIGQSVNPVILERILEVNPEYRAQGLRLHREFQEQINGMMSTTTVGQRSLTNFYESVKFMYPVFAVDIREDVELVALYGLTTIDKSPAKEAAERLRRKALHLPEIHKRILDMALADLGF